MARVTRVKRAQQRYATKPTIDPETGEQKVVPVLKKDGTPKTSKRGPIVRRLTERDLTKPLPMPKCDYPKCDHPTREIVPGESYMWIAPKSGPYGGRALHRHGDHPAWNVWEYSYSTSARVAQVTSEIEDMLHSMDWSEEGAFDDARQQAADMAGGIRDEKEEALNNMPEALQEGSQTQEQHEALETWVEEIESASEPDRPEAEEPDTTCPECNGSGQNEDPENDDADEDGMVDCEGCDGTGEVEPETEEPDWDAYGEECTEAIMEAVNNCYV